MHFTIRILRPCPTLGLEPGNLVTFEPDLATSEALYLHRPFPANLGAVLGLLESGSAELLTPHSTVADFAQAVGAPCPPGGRPGAAAPLPSPRGRLRLEP